MDAPSHARVKQLLDFITRQKAVLGVHEVSVAVALGRVPQFAA
jgi:hypothetical protein